MDSSVVPIPAVDSCAAGYRFYQCSDGGFSGCCSVDPCDIKTCPVESSPSSMSQAATSPSTTLVISTTSAKSSIVTTMTTPISMLVSSAYLAPLTASSASSSLLGTSSPVAVASVPPSSTGTASSSQVNTSGAIIGGVVGGVLFLITLAIAILFWYRMRKQSKAVNPDFEKWANDETSSSGRGGYGDSIFDSYFSNDADITTGVDHKKHATLPPPMGAVSTSLLNKPPPCVFPDTAQVESTSSKSSTKYFHIPSSSSPRFFKYVDGNPSAGSLLSDSSEQVSIAGGVPVAHSTRSVSGRSDVAGTGTILICMPGNNN